MLHTAELSIFKLKNLTEKIWNIIWRNNQGTDKLVERFD